MIRRLTLSNWRNYEDVSLDFREGTTFVVASNGVGKTSLVEAARWALFGMTSTQASQVRIGATSASVAVELILPSNRLLRVSRTVISVGLRQSMDVEVVLDGSSIGDVRFDEVIREEYGTETGFLARLAMPAVSRELDTPKGLGLEEHLGQYFGVDGIQRVIEMLRQQVKAVEKQIRSMKTTHAASAGQLAALQAEADHAGRAAEAAGSAYEAANEAKARIDTRAREHSTYEAWTARREEWIRSTKALAEEASDSLKAPLIVQELEEELSNEIDRQSRLAEETRLHAAVREARTNAIRANQERLDQAGHEDCPVCRRPLDDTTVSLAHESNDSELRTLDAEIAELRSAAARATAKKQVAADLLQKWRRLPHPGPGPQPPQFPAPAADEVALITERLQDALEGLIEARTKKSDADRDLREAQQADAAMKELQALFAQEARTRVALQAAEATLDELLAKTIKPLASEVSLRWQSLFPARGALSTRADGSVSRAVNGHELPFEAFSTGESMGATLVLRLLVTQMATSADFCWFDEPLEHLDPTVRRQVANILARATDGAGPLRQVLVTTYEEPLARRLQERNPDRVHLIDVRQGSPLPRS